jgi:hypothetical protein
MSKTVRYAIAFVVGYGSARLVHKLVGLSMPLAWLVSMVLCVVILTVLSDVIYPWLSRSGESQ